MTSAVLVLAAAVAALPATAVAHALARSYASKQAGPGFVVILCVAAATFALTAATMPSLALTGAGLGLTWALLCLATIDLAAFRLPDVFTLPLLCAGLAVAALLPGRPVLDHLAAAAVGWGGLAVLAGVYRRFRGRDGIGLGDAKLLGAGGAWLGAEALPSVLLIACAAAFVWVGFQIAVRGRVALSDRLAFGAPLCLAIWTVWLRGPLPG